MFCAADLSATSIVYVKKVDLHIMLYQNKNAFVGKKRHHDIMIR